MMMPHSRGLFGITIGLVAATAPSRSVVVVLV